jgi:hypothetical protein
MNDPVSLRYSFVVRCWRDANGLLRGWVVDALTQRYYPFIAPEEMAALIESLAQDSPAHNTLTVNDIKRNEDY